jgi:hypothetical protein
VKFTDLTGKRYGRLVVIKLDHSQKLPCGKIERHYLCKCNCGNYKVVRACTLRNGNTTSCGCYAREMLSKRQTTHNMSKTPLYKALDDNRWLEQIETIKYNEKRGYSIKVLNKWYDELGNNLHESPDDSTVQAISRDKENEIGLLTALNNNKTIKLPFKKEDWKNDVAPASHFENDQHRDKKTTLLSYNGHEFRLKVGDFVTLGFMFSSPVTFSSDP